MKRCVKKTMAWNKSVAMGLVAAAMGCVAGNTEAEVIEQTFQQGNSGSLNFGQYFELDSSIFSGPLELESIEFAKGSNVSAATSIYLDIYSIGTADISQLNFNPNSNSSTVGELAELDYLGSSTNALDLSSTITIPTGTTIKWTFSGISLPTDTEIFAVVSTVGDGDNDNHRGVSLRASRANEGGTFVGGAVYNNITTDISHPLFGGSATPDTPGEIVNDNFYTITLVPEPGSLALLSAGVLMIARRRRG